MFKMTASKHNNPLIQQLGNFQLDESLLIILISSKNIKLVKVKSIVKKYMYMEYNVIASNLNHNLFHFKRILFKILK